MEQRPKLLLAKAAVVTLAEAWVEENRGAAKLAAQAGGDGILLCLIRDLGPGEHADVDDLEVRG
jgi:hypothetical protein